MNARLSRRTFHAMAGTALALGLASAPSYAQETGIVEGQVFEGETGRPLAGVDVVVVGTKLHGVTDQGGWFRLTDVPAGPARLRLQLDGYASSVEPLDVVAGMTVIGDFALSGFAAVLDELTVLGSAREPSSRRDGVNIREVAGAEPRAENHHSLSEFLRGRVPGLQVQRLSGGVGSGSQMLLRGVKSISLSNEPVVYLDGVRLSSPSSPQGGGMSFLDVIDPSSIDHVEIISGPAASARYGPEAANGVILIHTKRGTDG